MICLLTSLLVVVVLNADRVGRRVSETSKSKLSVEEADAISTYVY